MSRKDFGTCTGEGGSPGCLYRAEGIKDGEPEAHCVVTCSVTVSRSPQRQRPRAGCLSLCSHTWPRAGAQNRRWMDPQEKGRESGSLSGLTTPLSREFTPGFAYKPRVPCSPEILDLNLPKAKASALAPHFSSCGPQQASRPGSTASATRSLQIARGLSGSHASGRMIPSGQCCLETRSPRVGLTGQPRNPNRPSGGKQPAAAQGGLEIRQKQVRRKRRRVPGGRGQERGRQAAHPCPASGLHQAGRPCSRNHGGSTRPLTGCPAHGKERGRPTQGLAAEQVTREGSQQLQVTDLERQLLMSRQVASGAEEDSPPGIQDQAHRSPCPRVLPALPLAPSWGAAEPNP
ncbi:uncharacterized protein LOC133092098 [Eubalaena glacialis]|uniref:uncharacterized protein LOC133092098 n=1 Tax=Eubalaena glacialis TaxID=27606 RepID=UPI002A5ADAF4|nr:uncharacterized protein LOC133092098 [Eubalaena glacialis]